MSLARVALRAPRVAAAANSAARTFSVQTALRGGAPTPTILQGPGAPEGMIPTDYEQATGVERYQLLGNMAGVDVFDMAPVEVGRMGTMQDPIKVNSIIDERIIGCTGYPVDSHELLWMKVEGETIGRCKECGCCYKLAYHNPWAAVIPEIAEATKDSKVVSTHDAHH